MDASRFSHLKAAAGRLGPRPELTRPELRELICHDCSFWHEEHEDELECSGFQMLAIMLAGGALTPESLERAVNGGGQDE